MQTILVTGGLGYIGSHTCVHLLQSGYRVVCVDNCSNSEHEVVCKIRNWVDYPNNFVFYYSDITNINDVFKYEHIDIVIHMAGLKSVNESIDHPLQYYENNVSGTITLLNVMNQYNCKRLIFSSSATVYGTAKAPFTEESQTGIGITNPYGRTKYMIEELLKDVYHSNNEWDITILRYFNPIGSHPSGLFRDNPKGIPANIMPYICQVLRGDLPHLNIFGDDYNTPDGTAIRDYIHVLDLVEGHESSLNSMNGLRIYNLGTGIGYSVSTLVDAINAVTDTMLKTEVVGRREGDVSILIIDRCSSR
jgi:UDP-glucose 4-epimerase